MPQNPSSLPKEFWDTKVARDNLLNDLEVLGGLLDIMYARATKELATSCCVLAFVYVGQISSTHPPSHVANSSGLEPSR